MAERIIRGVDNISIGQIVEDSTYNVTNDENYYYLPLLDNFIDTGVLKNLGNLAPVEYAVICGDTSMFNGTEYVYYDGTTAVSTPITDVPNIQYDGSDYQPIIPFSPEVRECVEEKRRTRGFGGILTVDELKLLTANTDLARGFTTSSYIKYGTILDPGLLTYTAVPNRGIYILRVHQDGYTRTALTNREQQLIGQSHYLTSDQPVLRL